MKPFFIVVLLCIFHASSLYSQDEVKTSKYSQYGKVKIFSNPEDVHLFISRTDYNKYVFGPKYYSFRIEEPSELILFKEGYHPFILPLKADSAFKEVHVSLTKYKSEFEGNKTRKTMFGKLAFNFDANKILGKTIMGINLQYTSAWDPELERGKQRITGEIEKAFLDDSLNIVQTVNEMFIVDDKNVEILLGAEVYDMWAVYNKNKMYCKVSVKWSVYDIRKGKVIGTFYSEGTGGATAGTIDYLAAAIYGAARSLSRNEKFKETLIKNDNYSEADSLKETTYIEKVKLQTFSSQGDLLKQSVESSVTVKTDFGHGSGAVVTSSGLILTNFHVIDGASKIEVIFSNGFTLEAEVIKLSEDRDVALLKTKAGSGFKPFPINLSDDASVGTEVFAIGTPEDITLGQSVTKGIVSGKRKFDEKVYIQTDVSINSGNSGGALVNMKGEVVGIVVAKIKQAGTEGLGFAIPIKEALEALKVEIK